MPTYDKSDLQRRMHGAVEALKHDLGGLRTGRASTALLDPVNVEVYGAQMPLNQVATVSVPEPRMLSVQVWDRSNVQPVEKAIRSAGLGLNPITDGQLIRLPIPDLTEERRKELAKICGQYAEKARIAVRNVRRDGMDHLKVDEKKHEISEDEHKRLEHEVQKLTDDTIKEIDAADHHGRERPLGRPAGFAARSRAPSRRRGRAQDAEGCRRCRRRSADALCLLIGELAAPRRRSQRAQGPACLLCRQGAGDASSRGRPAQADRRSVRFRPPVGAAPPAGRQTHGGQ
jgi:ribosome recycling factor